MIKDALISLALRQVMMRLMGWLALKIPFLAAGPIGWIVKAVAGHFIEKVLTYLIVEGVDGVVFLGIDIKTNSEHRVYAKAFDKWKKADTKEEKKNAEKELDKAFDDYVALDL